MEKELFERIISDNKSIKFGEWNRQHFIFEPENLVIEFFFKHSGYPKNYSSEPDRRIILNVLPQKKLNVDIPLKTIGDTTIIIVNSHNYDYAFTFMLTVDVDKRKVKVKINDMPVIGQILITDDEKHGIEIEY